MADLLNTFYFFITIDFVFRYLNLKMEGKPCCINLNNE